MLSFIIPYSCYIKTKIIVFTCIFYTDVIIGVTHAPDYYIIKFHGDQLYKMDYNLKREVLITSIKQLLRGRIVPTGTSLRSYVQ
jgi:hypothetical protein